MVRPASALPSLPPQRRGPADTNLIDFSNQLMRTESLTTLTSDDFARMVAPPGESQPVLTFLLPMERKGAETRKNPIVFKNAIAEAEELLADRPESPQQERSLQTLRNLTHPTDTYWQNQDRGLAVVIAEEEEPLFFQLPCSVGPYVSAGSRPYLSPLLRLMDPEHYWVLALDLNELQLYDATRWRVHPLDLEGVPTSLDEAMKLKP